MDNIVPYKAMVYIIIMIVYKKQQSFHENQYPKHQAGHTALTDAAVLHNLIQPLITLDLMDGMDVGTSHFYRSLDHSIWLIVT